MRSLEDFKSPDSNLTIMAVETRASLFWKLGIFGCIALSFGIIGKRLIANQREDRHRSETDARIDSLRNEFNIAVNQPGMPEQTSGPSDHIRKSQYEGAGGAYATRKKGDRLSMFAIFDRDWTGRKN